MHHTKGCRSVLALLLICSLVGFSVSALAQTETPTNNTTEITDAQATLRSNLLVQEQLHNALRAIEQARQDADSAAKRNAEIFNERLSTLEKSLTEQRNHDLEALRNSNRFILTAAAILGGVGLLALLCTAYFQVRALHRVAEVGTLVSALVPQNSQRALGEGSSFSPAQLGSADQSNARFVAAIEQLEKKIHQLDSTNLHASFHPGAAKLVSVEKNGHDSNGSKDAETLSRMNLLLTEGQMLLDRGDAENALVYFEQALDLEPNNTDALIKKGATLEALRKNVEAIEVYDRAIAMDSSMTVAYLYKGGVLNRLQRFSEAMECYEQALRTHPTSVA